MVENRIMITVPDNVTIISGAEIGLEAYKQCIRQIDDEAMNIICFPDHITKIIGTFFSGFFIDLRKSMTAGEIKEHFRFDSDMPCIESAEKAFRKYIGVIMSWRIEVIENQAKLDYKMGYMVVRGLETKRVLLDEIGILSQGFDQKWFYYAAGICLL